MRARAKRDEFELIEGSCYAAQPGGAASRDAYERMRDEILGQLKAALPVDGAVFNLHGAMVAHGYDDCEGDFLERVRALVGPKAVIGVELDPHCHLTEEALRRSPTSSCCSRSIRTRISPSAARRWSISRCAPSAARSSR